MFFKTGNSIIKNFDFLKRFGTFYDLLIGLCNRETSINKAEKEQNEMIEKITALSNFVSSEDINGEKSRGAIKKAKTKAQKNSKKFLKQIKVL